MATKPSSTAAKSGGRKPASKVASKVTTAQPASVAEAVTAAMPSTRDVLAMGMAAAKVVAEHAATEASEAAMVANLPKCAAARVQRGRPHPSLLHVITSKGQHKGTGDRIKRWHLYAVGMSLLHCRITEGLDHLDIGYYCRNTGTDGKPLMTIRPMTDAERKEATARWEGEATDAQPAAGTLPAGGTMNASDSAQPKAVIAEPGTLADKLRASGFAIAK